MLGLHHPTHGGMLGVAASQPVAALGLSVGPIMGIEGRAGALEVPGVVGQLHVDLEDAVRLGLELGHTCSPVTARMISAITRRPSLVSRRYLRRLSLASSSRISQPSATCLRLSRSVVPRKAL